MIEQLEETLNEKKFEDMSFELRTHERFLELRKLYQPDPRSPINSTPFVVRISQERIEQVQRLKKGNLLKDVIQMAVINYLITLDNETFELVKKTYEQSLELSE